MSKLDDLMTEFKAARSAVAHELLRQYPIGAELSFSIRHGQKIPSTGTVVGVGFHPGYVRVKHDQAKRGSRYGHRDVHYSQITAYADAQDHLHDAH